MPYTFGKGLLWILIGLLLGAIIGYLWHSWRCRNSASTTTSVDGTEEMTHLRNRVANLEPVVAERDRLKVKLGEVEGDLRACLASKSNIPAAAPMGLAAFAGGLGAADLDRARAVFGKAIRMDDLKIVEGIGPVLEGVFNAAGIETWVQLADAAPSRLREILVAADERHRMHNPETWPRQSRLAALGEFEALKAWQDSLDAGKD